MPKAIPIRFGNQLLPALALLTALNIAFVNFDTTASSPSVSEPEWQLALASTRVSPAVAAGSNSIVMTLNDEPGESISLGKTKIVINAPPLYEKTWTVFAPATGSADGIFDGPLAEIKTWQKSNPGKSARLLIKRGTYRFTNRLKYPMEVTGFERLVVRGDVFGDERPKFLINNLKRAAVRIIDSSLVKFSGVEIEYKLGPTVVGEISDNSDYGNHIAYRGKMVGPNTISSDMPPQLAATIMSIRSFDPTHDLWFDRTSGVSPTHKGVWDLLEIPSGSTTSPNTLVHVGDKLFRSPALGEFKDGENVILIKTRRGYGGGFFVGGASSDITIHGLVIRNYPQMGIRIENAGRGFHILGNQIVPKEGEAMSGRADGISIVGTLGDIIVENNLIASNGDDGINVRGTDVDMKSIVKTADSKLQVVVDLLHGGYLATGNRVAIYANGAPLALANAEAISPTEFKLTLTQERPCDSACLDSLVSSVQEALSTQRATLFNLSRTSSRFLVRNNRFWKNGGRGIVVHAPNGAVRDNQIYYPALPAILARLSDGGVISEGPGPINVSIEGNRIHGANHGYSSRNRVLNASVVVTNATRPEDTFRFAQRMLVRNNCISNSGHAAMNFDSTRAMEIGGNIIGTFNQAPRPTGETATEAVTVNRSVAFFRHPDVDRTSLSCLAEE